MSDMGCFSSGGALKCKGFPNWFVFGLNMLSATWGEFEMLLRSSKSNKHSLTLQTIHFIEHTSCQNVNNLTFKVMMGWFYS